MKNIKLLVAMSLVASTAFASNLNRPQEMVEERRNHFIDYSTNNKSAEVSYTVGVQVGAVKPMLSSSIGFESFDAEEENLFVEGSTLGFENQVIPSISAQVIFSDQNSATLFTITLDHYNKFGSDEAYVAGENSNIFINHFFHGNNDVTAYSKIQNTFNNEQTTLKAAIGGYSIQYKNFSLSSLVGLTGNHMLLETGVKATEASSSDLLVNTFAGSQSSISGGIYCGLRPSLVLFESDFSSLYLSAELNFTGEVSANRGNVFHYQMNVETELQTNTSNIAIDPRSLTSTVEKKLSLTLVSKAQENDMSFFSLEFGIGHSVASGRDMISKAQSGKAGDLSTSFGFLSLSYTM
ncbi:MAG: hypothetical protein SP4CHLAM5_07090 [Chlamydiia bacterium]|nr:hypothetical protein [Chlamydiia bacterium]MCH9618576.1 hypothetical protein [Chlamydiia bacterium]MCH9623885.1 hypothetical protein [Chlamydiia bacterium]